MPTIARPPDLKVMSDSVIALDLFREQPVLTGQRVRLEPLTPAVLDDYLAALANPEIAVAPGTQTVIMLSPWGQGTRVPSARSIDADRLPNFQLCPDAVDYRVGELVGKTVTAQVGGLGAAAHRLEDRFVYGAGGALRGRFLDKS